MARFHTYVFTALATATTGVAALAAPVAAQTPTPAAATDATATPDAATATPAAAVTATAIPPTAAPVPDDEPPPRPAVAKVPVLDFIGPSTDIGMIGAELTPRKYASPREESVFEIHGAFRSRGIALRNLDLDRGLDTSGQSLYPVPLDGGQWLTVGDARLRTDLSFYAAGMGVAVKARVDWLDNIGLGSTPIAGTPRAASFSASPGQRGITPVVKRAWGEVLLPVGVLAVGRMGAHFGLGMVANGGDCSDCNGGDSADRIAFAMALKGHVLAASYDIAASGPFTPAQAQDNVIDLTPTDDVSTWTLALLNIAVPATLERRSAVGLTTLQYAAYLSHRTQDRDVPSAYLPGGLGSTGAVATANDLIQRDFSATTFGGWLRWSRADFRLEAEAVGSFATVGQPSTIPGAEITQEATSQQWGVALESEYALGNARFGFNAGAASGDDAPGFGAFPNPTQAVTPAGSLDGPQVRFPRDTTIDNFRFHPDYIVDEIMFRRIIGTVTDAVYLRPHAGVRLANVGATAIDLTGAVVASWALEAASTPSGASRLGVETILGLRVWSRDGFAVRGTYAAFLPGPAFDNTSLAAQAAQLWRADVSFRF